MSRLLEVEELSFHLQLEDAVSRFLLYSISPAFLLAPPCYCNYSNLYLPPQSLGLLRHQSDHRRGGSSVDEL